MVLVVEKLREGELPEHEQAGQQPADISSGGQQAADEQADGQQEGQLLPERTDGGELLTQALQQRLRVVVFGQQGGAGLHGQYLRPLPAKFCSGLLAGEDDGTGGRHRREGGGQLVAAHSGARLAEVLEGGSVAVEVEVLRLWLLCTAIALAAGGELLPAVVKAAQPVREHGETALCQEQRMAHPGMRPHEQAEASQKQCGQYPAQGMAVPACRQREDEREKRRAAPQDEPAVFLL